MRGHALYSYTIFPCEFYSRIYVSYAFLRSTDQCYFDGGDTSHLLEVIVRLRMEVEILNQLVIWPQSYTLYLCCEWKFNILSRNYRFNAYFRINNVHIFHIFGLHVIFWFGQSAQRKIKGGASIRVRAPLQVFSSVTSLVQVVIAEEQPHPFWYMDIHHAVLEFSKLCQCRYVGLRFSALTLITEGIV